MRAHAEGARRAWLLLLAVAPFATAAAQDDVPRAPRLVAEPAAAGAATAPAAAPATASLGALRPPNAATLAPLPEQRSEATEEIIVIGQGWRLPDLGSVWRERQAEAERSGRFHATLLPLYDPARPPLRNDTLLQNREARRHGYIELFRLGFGRRSPD